MAKLARFMRKIITTVLLQSNKTLKIKHLKQTLKYRCREAKNCFFSIFSEESCRLTNFSLIFHKNLLTGKVCDMVIKFPFLFFLFFTFSYQAQTYSITELDSITNMYKAKGDIEKAVDFNQNALKQYKKMTICRE
ncbi:hypothetical protein [Chryseobacterium wanjuense]